MSFESIPEDKEESYPCPECEEGNITLAIDGIWECSHCHWHNPATDKEVDENHSY